MDIDPRTHKMNWKTLTKDEAKVALVFLVTEVDRHKMDIQATDKLMTRIEKKFELSRPVSSI